MAHHAATLPLHWAYVNCVTMSWSQYLVDFIRKSATQHNTSSWFKLENMSWASCLLRHLWQVEQKALQCTACTLGSLAVLASKVGLSSSSNGTTLSVAHDQNQLGSQFATAEFQASNHAAFSMGASVACIPQHKQITWHCIKNCVDRHTRICTAQDGCMWCLPVGHQSLPHLASGMLGQRSTPRQSVRCPAFNIFKASSAETGSSAVVRSPCVPRAGGP